MIDDLIILGAGNPDIVRIIEDINLFEKRYNILGFTDSNTNLIGTIFFGYPVIGTDDVLDDKIYCKAKIINNIYESQTVRQRAYNNFAKYTNRFCNIVHPSVKYRQLNIGTGNIIADDVIIQSDVKIGNHNIIHSATIISHETKIGNNCLFSVNVTIGSRSEIGDYCYFGISSTTLPGIKIGSSSYIGGGAVLLNSILENSKVFGNPARNMPIKGKD